MTDRPQLPIDRLTDEEFNVFKAQYLARDRPLEGPVVERIREMFGLHNPMVARPCDEAHARRYGYVEYRHPAACVIDRLTLELRLYQQSFNEISDRARQITEVVRARTDT